MDQTNGASQDELQQAINNITNNSTTAGADTVAEVTNKLAEQQTATSTAAPAAPAMPTPPVMPAQPAAPSIDNIPIEQTKAMYGDPDLDKIKNLALSDLRPILEKVDIAPDKKFLIYRDIIELTEDKACIELAYNSARLIEDEKTKGEALVFIVECIDKLGIQMTIGGDQ